MKTLLVIALALAASGCSWVGRQADALGAYMPVVGERCEHWQCVTTAGKERSEEIRKVREEALKAPQDATPEETVPVAGEEPAQEGAKEDLPVEEKKAATAE